MPETPQSVPTSSQRTYDASVASAEAVADSAGRGFTPHEDGHPIVLTADRVTIRPSAWRSARALCSVAVLTQ